MTDEELDEIFKRYGWAPGDHIPRGMLLDIMLPAVNALFGLEYATLESVGQDKK